MSEQSWVNRILGRGAKDPQDPCTQPGASASGCAEARDRASDYLEGDVDVPVGTRIRQHLGLCTDCDSWVDSLKSTIDMLRGLPREEVPESLREKIRELPGE